MSQMPVFGDVAREWWERYMLIGCRSYAEESWRRMEREALPSLGGKTLKQITPPMILKILRRIEDRGASVPAQKLRSHISQIMRYGIACGYTYTNPARDLSHALKPRKHVPRAALTEPRQIGLLMRRIAEHKPLKRRCSLKFAALTFVRPGELCQAEWTEIEWDNAVWRIPGAKMKMKRPHHVPLAKQTLELLRELRTYSGQGQWLFPSRWDKARHERGNVLTIAIRRMGYTGQEMTAHGFRAMAATTLSEQGWASDLIELQLAHVDKNRIRAAYQRSERLAERAKMMQAWADWLDMRTAWAILGR
jgi:integrase